MKVINILLSVFIFLLAAASAVFSYFLFEKRGQMVDGWNKMASAIQKTATELDANSGAQSLATELDAASLGHKQYAGLDAKLPKLAERARQVVLTRDGLAKALEVIGKAVGSNVAASGLCAIDSYAAQSNRVVKAVSDVISARDRQYNSLNSFARSNYNVSLNLASLKSGSANALDPLKQAVAKEKARRSEYEAQLRLIAGYAGAAALNTSDTGYTASVKAIASKVQKLRSDLRTRDNELKSTRDTLAQRDRQLGAAKAEIAAKNAEISKRDELILGYRKALGIAEGEDDVMAWKRGSAEARQALAGEVVEVHNDYGYVVINLGTDTRVVQTIGNRTLEVDPAIEKGMELVIAEGELAAGNEFIARVTVDEIGSGHLTANIPVDSKAIKAGYKVFWIQAK